LQEQSTCKLSKLVNIEKSCKGVRKSRHGIIGGRKSKGTSHVACIQTCKSCDKWFENHFYGYYKSLWGLPFKPWSIGLLFAWYSWFGNMERCIAWIEKWTKYNREFWQWNDLENFTNFLWPHQDMFLDIACFFVGFKKSTFCRVYWNGDDSSNLMLILQNLKDKFLIKWAEDGSLYMHEQLRNMGQNIATKVIMSQFIAKELGLSNTY